MFHPKGLWNCHVVGVQSLVLRERVDDNNGMYRIFYADSDVLNTNLPMQGSVIQRDFVLMPHNHKQDLKFTKLFGEVVQIWYEFGPSEDSLYEYEFTSALHGGDFGLQLRRCMPVKKVHAHHMGSNGYCDCSFFMRSVDVHTVRATAGSAWLVEEGQLDKDLTPLCYSRFPDKKLDKTNLYKPMTDQEADTLWQKICLRAPNQTSRLLDRLK